jgi:hypothetical protein
MSNEKHTSEIRLIQLNNYIRPDVVENKSKNWVLNGKNNDFFDYLIKRNIGSPTNSSINASYTDLIYGQGLTSDNTEGLKILNEMLKPKELRKIIYDFQLFNGAKIQKINKKGKKLRPDLFHMAQNLVAPSVENEDGEIEHYWFSRDWTKQWQNKPVSYPSFGTTEEAIEIYDLKPYQAGKVYFSDPTYISCLSYCEVEEEIGNYALSHIKNGLSFGYIINVPDGKQMSTEEKDEFEKKIKEKLVGSPNAGKFVLSFNGRDAEITITPIIVNDAHKQWSFLTEESKQQILTAHRATSPSLVGLVSSSGFSNTAEEMDMMEKQLLKRVIKPKQDFILDALEEIMLFYGVELDLKFIPLSENTDASNTEEIKDEVETEEELKKPLIKRVGLKKKSNAELLIDLGDEIDLTEYDLVYDEAVDYDDDFDFEQSINLASTGTARPNAKSEQDSDDIVIRYKYVGNPSPEREFCNKMMRADKIYRKEDIIAMENQAVNPGFGMDGVDTYSIWLYKGGGLLSDAFPGGTCKHKWNRVIYLKKGKSVDVRSPLAEKISTTKARSKGYKVPTNDTKVSIAPHNMK